MLDFGCTVCGVSVPLRTGHTLSDGSWLCAQCAVEEARGFSRKTHVREVLREQWQSMCFVILLYRELDNGDGTYFDDDGGLEPGRSVYFGCDLRSAHERVYRAS